VLRRCIHGGVLALAGAAAALPALAELGSEQVTVGSLPPATPHRIYLTDVAIAHIVDGKLLVIDGKSMKVLGMVATGFAGQTTLSPDRSELYVATSYFAKLNRGERIDQVDVYDTQTLALKSEIVIPPKHAQALPYKGTIRASADGRFLFVQNATPASSVSVVDLKAGKLVGEIATPGCWIVLPAQSAPQRFSTLCGDGTMLTVTLDAEGKQQTQKRSQRFFDPDGDALFVAADSIDDRYYFVSFKGRVHVANVGGEEASFEPPWSLVGAADAKEGWRPGGYQPLALHAGSGRLYVGMHAKGAEGSHKNPAQQIWAFDLQTKKRIARVPGHNAVALAVTREARAPTLYAFDPVKTAIVVYDAGAKVAFKRRADGFGETPTQLELH
jgi:methylamine dehydrogenase heavy chain